jgi:hypothetical protein
MMELRLMDGRYAVAKFPPDTTPPVTNNHSNGSFLSVTWTEEECSVVSLEGSIPDGYLEINNGWAVIRIEGVLDFELVGVLQSVLMPLGKAGVSVFTLSTYNTDYVLVKTDSLDSAVSSLRSAGFVVGVS